MKSLKQSLKNLDNDQGKLKQDFSNLKKSVKAKDSTIYRLETITDNLEDNHKKMKEFVISTMQEKKKLKELTELKEKSSCLSSNSPQAWEDSRSI